MATIAELKVKIGANVTDFDKKLSGIQSKMKATGKKMQSMGKSMTIGITAPIGLLGAAALKSSADLETMEVAFQSLLGSGEAASKMVKDLSDFTARTPFQLEGVGKAAKQLLSFGVQGDEVMGKLKFLGDIAAGANIPLSDMASIFGKSKAKGKAMTEELLQLSDRGVPVIDTLAKSMGVGKDAIFDMASKGEISFAKLQNALMSLTTEGGVFANQMEKQSNTLAGIWSTLTDNVGLALAEVGNTIVDTFDLKEVLKSAIGWIQGLVKGFQDLGPGTKKIIILVTGLAAAIGPLLVSLGFLTSTVLPALMTGFSILIGPIGLVVAAVAGAAILIITYWDEIVEYFTSGGGSEMWAQVVDTWNKGVEMVKTLISQATAGIIYIWETYNAEILAVFNMAVGYLKKVWSTIFGVIKNYLSIIGDLFDFWTAIFKGDWETVWNEAKSIVFKVFKTIIEVLSSGLDIILAGVGKVVSLFNEDWANAINGARDGISEFSNKLIEGAAEWLGYEEDVKKATKAVKDFEDTVEDVKPTLPTPTPPGGGGAGAGAGVPTGDDPMMMMLEQIERWEQPINDLREAFKKADAEARVFGTTISDVLTAKIDMTKNAISEAIDKFGEEHQVVKDLVEELKNLEDAQANVGISADQMLSKISNTLSQVASAVGQIAGQVTSIINQNFEARKIALDNYYGAEKEKIDAAGMSEEAHANAMALLDERVAKKKSEMAKKKAKADKKAALVAAMVNTAAAVASALTIQPAPVGIVMAGIVGALGAAQIAAINATPIPSFAEGGIIGAPMIAQVGDAPSGPEVVAPLSKLQSMMGGAMELKTVIRGEDIILVTDRTKSNRGFIT